MEVKNLRYNQLKRILWITGILTGSVTLGLGLLVIVGWHLGNRTLIQVVPGFVPMQAAQPDSEKRK